MHLTASDEGNGDEEEMTSYAFRMRVHRPTHRHTHADTHTHTHTHTHTTIQTHTDTHPNTDKHITGFPQRIP